MNQKSIPFAGIFKILGEKFAQLIIEWATKQTATQLTLLSLSVSSCLLCGYFAFQNNLAYERISSLENEKSEILKDNVKDLKKANEELSKSRWGFIDDCDSLRRKIKKMNK